MLARDANRKWWILGAMGGVLAVILLDFTVVGVALPSMKKEIGLSELGSHWVINAYFLVMAVGVAVFGRLGDIIGQKSILFSGLIIFGVSSLLCAAAQNTEMIVGARIGQGLGAALIFPCGMSIIANVFEPEQRGFAYGIQTATSGIAMALGPLTGGIISNFISWRGVFWINAPIVLAIVLIMLWKGRDKPNTLLERNVYSPKQVRKEPFDYVGCSLFCVGLSFCVIALLQISDWGYLVAAIGIIAGICLLALFSVMERKNKNPFMDVSLFSDKGFSSYNLVVVAGQFMQTAAVVFVPIYLQSGMGFSPLMAGVAMLPAVIHLPLTGLWCGRLSDVHSERTLAIITIFASAVTLSMFGFAAYYKSYWLFVPALILWGFALPFHFVPMRKAVVASVTSNKVGQASGICIAAQLVGGTIYVSYAGAVLSLSDSYPFLFISSGLLLLLAWLVVLAWMPQKLVTPNE
ncbi:MFS transporter [Flexibacterium corallicola]|uniref:MFS transporter n=1 Tax=Flexibacterium corallicola TaxID=3037259 RepID=UPI00286F24B6|nr:MFS transporter [Pseudovibrio sp. M1P-2-3]